MYHLYYADKIIHGVYVANLNLEGQNIDNAFRILHENLLPNEKVIVHIGESYTKEIKPEDIGFEYLYVDTVSRAFRIGREKSLVKSLVEKFNGLTKKLEVNPTYKTDPQKLSDVISDIQSEAGIIVKEPSFVINKDGSIDIVDGESGLYLDSVSLGNSISNAFYFGSNSSVYADLETKTPILSISDLDLVRGEFKKLHDKNLKIIYGDLTWKLSDEQFLSLVVPQKVNGKVELTVSDEALKKLISDLSLEIDRSAKAQKLEIVDGEVVNFESSTDGLRVNNIESSKKIKTALLSSATEVELVVDVDAPSKPENEYGIRELIGIGKSTFHHSSKSRIHNVGLAASRVSGTLVPPGEVFSFNNAVGEISRKTGYTSAWVISKGRTVLGDGGGVCQVSTTLFRAALDAGLPIVERKAHSYRVGYYEQNSPPGIDATIYSPSVDLKFKNDTGNYLLVFADFDEKAQSLDFRIFGTKDNRVVEMTEPKILSRTAPPAPVYEDDPTLPVGTLRRVESPVSGANVVFTRKVTKDGVVLYDDVFRSNYRAWGAVYKRGTKE